MDSAVILVVDDDKAIQYLMAQILHDKFRCFLASNADAVVGCDISCLMNIQGRLSRTGSPVRAMHIAQLLAKGIA